MPNNIKQLYRSVISEFGRRRSSANRIFGQALSMAKYTREDVDRLAGEIRRAKDRGRPFAALIGAGCSIEAGIPLAPALVRELAERYSGRIGRLPEERREDYGACMGVLTASERKDILKPHLDKAKVNWANIALASLLSRGFLDRVLTINFDQVLARGCRLCGYGPAIYDFGVSPAQTFDHLVEGCIIHLHGQSYGLTMMNSEEETTAHANALRPLIRDTLERHPLLVMGYSGRNDHIFHALNEEYKSKEYLNPLTFAVFAQMREALPNSSAARRRIGSSSNSRKRWIAGRRC
jgi:hypothetical protein